MIRPGFSAFDSRFASAAVELQYTGISAGSDGGQDVLSGTGGRK
jgi:hypothetical protein